MRERAGAGARVRLLLSALILCSLTGTPIVSGSYQSEADQGSEEPKWEKRFPPSAPTPRWGHATAYMETTGRVLLFGGTYGGWGAVGETWAFDSATENWSHIPATVGPEPRIAASMAYASSIEKVVLFGGIRTPGPFGDHGDTWLFDPSNDRWENVTSAFRPSNRSRTATAYDRSADRVVIFGGCCPMPNGTENDTWEFDPVRRAWEKANPLVKPRFRYSAAMVYVPSVARILMYGGHDAGAYYYNDTWLYDVRNDTWEEIVSRNAAPSKSYHSLVFLPASGLVLAQGGRPDMNSWTFNLANRSWSPAPGMEHSGPTEFGTVDVLGASPRLVAFGGRGVYGGVGDTNIGDTKALKWIRNLPASAPSARLRAAASYDEAAERLVLFGGMNDGMATGGWGYGLLNDTWAYDPRLNQWVRRAVAGGPPLAPIAYGAYAPGLGRMLTLLVNAQSGKVETWSYHHGSDAWENLSEVPWTGPFSAMGLAWDRSRSVAVTVLSEYPHDKPPTVWVFEPTGRVWSRLDTSGYSGKMGDMSFGYAGEGRMLFVPGYQERETWLLDVRNRTWSNITDHGGPKDRAWASVTYDPTEDRALVYGGFNGTYFPELWEYRVRNGEWKLLDAAGAPGGRLGHTFGCARTVLLCVLFGGSMKERYFDGETWVWASGLPVLPTEPPPDKQPLILAAAGSSAALGGAFVLLVFFLRRRRKRNGSSPGPSEEARRGAARKAVAGRRGT